MMRYGRNHLQKTALFMVLLFLGTLLLGAVVHGDVEEDVIYRDYEWEFQDRTWNWRFGATTEQYEYFKELKRLQTDDYSLYVTNPYDDEFIKGLVDSARQAQVDYGLTDRELIDFFVAFVQSLPYVTDKVGTGFDEYPKYPLETLIENGGDCEDTSILMAAILEEMGYGVVLLGLPGHMAVGVKGSDDLPGTYYSYGGAKYFYLETTGENYTIGQIPEEYKDAKATFYTIVPKPLINFTWKTYYDKGNMIKVTIKNEGTGGAENCQVYVAFDAGKGKVYNPKRSAKFQMPSQSGYTLKMSLQYPKKTKTRLLVKILSDGKVISESYSKWFTTN